MIFEICGAELILGRWVRNTQRTPRSHYGPDQNGYIYFIFTEISVLNWIQLICTRSTRADPRIKKKWLVFDTQSLFWEFAVLSITVMGYLLFWQYHTFFICFVLDPYQVRHFKPGPHISVFRTRIRKTSNVEPVTFLLMAIYMGKNDLPSLY